LQHEAVQTRCRQLRERMAHDREQAVEAERANAQKRLNDGAERYEAAAQAARMRLAADHDRRFTEAEDTWRGEKRELQEQVKSLTGLAEELRLARDEGVAAARDAEKRSHAAALKVQRTHHEICCVACVCQHGAHLVLQVIAPLW
jgi:hypothetical protein